MCEGNLLIRNYSVACPEIKNLERYMCSRFFIDFNEIGQQRSKLDSYLTNHFNCDDWTKTQYLMQLYKVVDESTVCLMGHERRQTLALIEEMAYRFYIRSQQQQSQHASHHHFQFPHFSHYSNNTKQNQTATQFFPHHVHHHLFPRHTHYDHLIVASQQQQQSNNKSNQNNNQNNPNLTVAAKSSTTNSTTAKNVSNSNQNSTSNANSTATTTAAPSNISKNNNSSSNQTNAQQSTHHSNSHNTSNCKNSTKNQQQQNLNQQQSQQHIQQQYHAYLFGTTGANAFYYNPYHHHPNYQAHNYHDTCQCGSVWMACA